MGKPLRVSHKFVPGVFLRVLLPGLIVEETDVFFNVFFLLQWRFDLKSVISLAAKSLSSGPIHVHFDLLGA